MKYSLNSNDHKSLKISFRTLYNNWQAHVTERLVGNYIEDKLIPALKYQGWNEVIFTPYAWFNHEENFWEQKLEQKFFIENGLYPTKELLETFKKLTRLLENTPDGFLVKLRKTERTKPLKEALKEFSLSLENSRIDWRGNGGFREHDENEQLPEQLPIVNGEIEVIEVKSGNAILPPNQKRSYGKILQEGFVLRFFHVNVISFEKNEFEIKEKIITNPDELNTSQEFFQIVKKS